MKTEALPAERIRLRTLIDFIGQDVIVCAGKLLRRAIEADRLFSSISIKFQIALIIYIQRY